MAKIAKAKAKPARRPKQKQTAAKRSSGASRKTARKPAARKTKARRRAA